MRGLSLKLKEERGIAVLIVALLLIPLILAVLEAESSSDTSVYAADVDLQEAAAFAAKSAAGSVLGAAQANGVIRVDAAAAHASFRDTLARNMGLDPATLAPLSGSPYASAPRYWLVVYNGYDDYAPQAPGGTLFYFDGSTAVQSAFPYSGFPAKFAVSPTGIASGAGGTFTATLESPGAVALVEADARKVVGRGTLSVQRWAAARVVCKAGTCRVQ